MRLPEDSGRQGVFFELEYPPRVVRITKDSEGLLLVASGEEHDQGIPADDFADYFLRWLSLLHWAINLSYTRVHFLRAASRHCPAKPGGSPGSPNMPQTALSAPIFVLHWREHPHL